MNLNPMDGPIPGENFTSDTKNYPWHRPPEYTDLDAAIEASYKKLTDENAALGVLTMIKMGMDIASLTEIFVMSGVGAGKWTPDFAILMAGPVSHIIYMMAKGYGLNPDLGIDKNSLPITSAFFETNKKINSTKAKKAGEDVDLEGIKEQAKSGFMGMPSEMPSEMSEEMTEEVDTPEEEIGEY